MNNNEIKDLVLGITCDIFNARDAVFAIKVLADYSDGEDMTQVLASIGTIATRLYNALDESGSKLQSIDLGAEKDA